MKHVLIIRSRLPEDEFKRLAEEFGRVPDVCVDTADLAAPGADTGAVLEAVFAADAAQVW